MNRKRVIYIGILLIITVIASITYFSYAFLTKVEEQHGKINIVAGTLDYKLESSDLTNNSITVTGTKLIDIKLISLNSVSSKYELYYTSTNNNVVVEYIDSNELDSSGGEIGANAIKNIQVRITASTSTTVTFGVKGGFISNTLALDTNENSLIAGEIVLPPTITGGSNNWVAVAPTISISTSGSASKGVANYEYYKTISTTLPTESTVATGTLTASPYSLTVSDNGTTYIYYRTVSTTGKKSEWSSGQIVKLDNGPSPGTLTSAPSTVNSITANYGAASSLSGIKTTSCYYGTTNNPTTAGTVSGNNCAFSSLSANTTYYFKKCVTNNAGTTACSNVSSKITAGQVYNYAYTGGIQSLTTPYSGTYKLEVWGAQGGSYDSTHFGGYGGYSIGSVSYNSNTTLYIVIGGAGVKTNSSATLVSGGYNGGGSARGYGGTGGGATHIATTNRGVLDKYSSYKGEILVVAGGGGGAAAFNYTGITGAAGGGYQGNNAYKYNNTVFDGTCGTQSSFGIAVSASFATGANGSNGTFGAGGAGGYEYINSRNEGAGGGGAGYYGGAGGSARDYSGGGGSGYIGNSLLSNRHMYCYNCSTSTATATRTNSGTCVSGTATADCAKSGNGYARITITNIN